MHTLRRRSNPQAMQFYASVGGILKIWFLLKDLNFLFLRLIQCMKTTPHESIVEED
jgi:hypothetical protein